MNVWAPALDFVLIELLGHLGAEAWVGLEDLRHADRSIVAIERLSPSTRNGSAWARAIAALIFRGSVDFSTLGPTTW